MILYFSATGNCKYVAARLAQAFDQRTLSIVECIRESNYAFEDSTLGIILPTYHLGLPSIMKEFLEKSSFAAEYLYFISTYGTTPGASGAIAQKAVHGRKIDAFYSVRMADTWTPTFDLSTPEKIAAFTAATEMQIDGIIRGVNERRANARMFPRLPAFLAELTAQPIYNVCARKTAHLHVEQDRCTGCGLCAKSARYRQSPCRTDGPCGFGRSARCAWAACIAAPGLPYSTENARKRTASTQTRM